MKNFLFLSSFFFTVLFLSPIETSAQWIHTNAPSDRILALVSYGSDLFAGNGSVFLSTNNGNDWDTVNFGLPSSLVNSFAIIDTNLFVGTSDGVYRSTNNGTSWAAAYSGMRNSFTITLTASGKNLYAGIGGGGVCLSTDNGASWTEISSNLPIKPLPPQLPLVNAIAVVGKNLFAGTDGDGVFLSTNNGTSWTAINNGLTWPYVFSFAFIDTNLFAGTMVGGVFLWNNNSHNWTAVDSVIKETWSDVRALAVSGKNLFAGLWGSNNSVFLSTNNGTSWTKVDIGLQNVGVWSLATKDNYLFAGTDIGVWRRPLSELITSVEHNSAQLPKRFALQQNYPNPFNPSTTISFNLCSKSYVSLIIYDALGREVSLLVSKVLEAGTYTKQWNASALQSGVYFCRLQTGSFSETKKLVLLR